MAREEPFGLEQKTEREVTECWPSRGRQATWRGGAASPKGRLEGYEEERRGHGLLWDPPAIMEPGRLGLRGGARRP